jgi:hypothetical protein
MLTIGTISSMAPGKWFCLLAGAEGWRELSPGKKLLTWLASQLIILSLAGVAVVIWILVTRH